MTYGSNDLNFGIHSKDKRYHLELLVNLTILHKGGIDMVSKFLLHLLKIWASLLKPLRASDGCEYVVLCGALHLGGWN